MTWSANTDKCCRKFLLEQDKCLACSCRNADYYPERSPWGLREVSTKGDQRMSSLRTLPLFVYANHLEFGFWTFSDDVLSTSRCKLSQVNRLWKDFCRQNRSLVHLQTVWISIVCYLYRLKFHLLKFYHLPPSSFEPFHWKSSSRLYAPMILLASKLWYTASLFIVFCHSGASREIV